MSDSRRSSSCSRRCRTGSIKPRARCPAAKRRWWRWGGPSCRIPKLLLLDEPTAGLSPKYVDQLLTTIQRIHKERNLSVLLAEQNATAALAVADRALILALGRVFLNTEAAQVDTSALKQGYRI